MLVEFLKLPLDFAKIFSQLINMKNVYLRSFPLGIFFCSKSLLECCKWKKNSRRSANKFFIFNIKQRNMRVLSRIVRILTISLIQRFDIFNKSFNSLQSLTLYVKNNWTWLLAKILLDDSSNGIKILMKIKGWFFRHCA